MGNGSRRAIYRHTGIHSEKGRDSGSNFIPSRYTRGRELLTCPELQVGRVRCLLLYFRVSSVPRTGSSVSFDLIMSFCVSSEISKENTLFYNGVHGGGSCVVSFSSHVILCIRQITTKDSDISFTRFTTF